MVFGAFWRVFAKTRKSENHEYFPYVRSETIGISCEVQVGYRTAPPWGVKVVPEGLKVVLEGLKALQGILIQEAGRLGEPARG